MQSATANPQWISTLVNAVSLLLGGTLLGSIVTWLLNRREQKARTQKIWIEIEGEQIDHYKGFSEAMKLMRQDVTDAENKLRETKKEKARLEKQNEDLMRQNRSLENENRRLRERK